MMFGEKRNIFIKLLKYPEESCGKFGKRKSILEINKGPKSDNVIDTIEDEVIPQ